MLVKSTALVLRKTPYSENSAIYSIFTKSHGILSFIVQGLHGKTGKAAILQSGNLIEIVFYFQSNKNLKRIKEIKLLDGFLGYNSNPVQLQVMTFCIELLQKTLPEEHEDPAVFEFIQRHLGELSVSHNVGWFPLKFMLGLSEVMGLGLQLNDGKDNNMLLLESNENVNYKTKLHPLQYLDSFEIIACNEIIHRSKCNLDLGQKRLLTEKLLYYFKSHLFPDKEIKSFPILMEILA